MALAEEIKKVARAPGSSKEETGNLKVSIDQLVPAPRFGEDLIKEVRKELASLSGPGEAGYSAWYHPHLWASTDGDDIVYYEKLHRAALKHWRKAERTGIGLPAGDLSRIDPHVLKGVGLGKGMRAARQARRRIIRSTPLSADPRAATYAQHSAMMVSAALDPLHRKLRKG